MSTFTDFVTARSGRARISTGADVARLFDESVSKNPNGSAPRAVFVTVAPSAAVTAANTSTSKRPPTGSCGSAKPPSNCEVVGALAQRFPASVEQRAAVSARPTGASSVRIVPAETTTGPLFVALIVYVIVSRGVTSVTDVDLRTCKSVPRMPLTLTVALSGSAFTP